MISRYWGYVCAPVLYAAANMGIPTVSKTAQQELQILQRKVSKIEICFDAVRKDFKKYEDKVVMTGNPRGQELANAQKDDSYLASIGIQKETNRTDFRRKLWSLRMNESFISYLKNSEKKIIKQSWSLDKCIMTKSTISITSLKKPLQNITVLPYINNMVQMFPKHEPGCLQKLNNNID